MNYLSSWCSNAQTSIQLTFHPKKGMEKQTNALIQYHIKRMVSDLIPLMDASKIDIDAFLAVMKTTDDQLVVSSTPISTASLPEVVSTFPRENRTESSSRRCPGARRLILSSHSVSSSKAERQSCRVDDALMTKEFGTGTAGNIDVAGKLQCHEQMPVCGVWNLKQKERLCGYEQLLQTSPRPGAEIGRLHSLSVYDGQPTQTSRRTAQMLDAEYGSRWHTAKDVRELCIDR